jgi:predicted enzyme related to lactoylglutathione lyase
METTETSEATAATEAAAPAQTAEVTPAEVTPGAETTSTLEAMQTTQATGKTSFQVGLIMLYVGDLAKTRAFYEGTLGLPVVPQLSGDEFVFLQPAGGSPIALQRTSAAPEGMRPEPGGYELGFEVDDVDAVLTSWTEHGVPGLTAIVDMGAGRMFRAQDPDGRIINVYTLYPQVRDFRRGQGI